MSLAAAFHPASAVVPDVFSPRATMAAAENDAAQAAPPAARWSEQDFGGVAARSATRAGYPLVEPSAAEQQDGLFEQAAQVVELTPAGCLAQADSAPHDSALADCWAGSMADDR